MQGLEDIPVLFAGFMDITLESAQVILSIVVILTILLPTMYLSRGSKSVTIEIVMLFLTETVLVGIGWMPFWVLIGTVAAFALSVALLGTKLVTGD